MTPIRSAAPAILAASGLALGLAACTPAADPCAAANRDINLITLAGNSAAGNYGACIEDLQGELQQLRLEANSLQARADELNRQARSASAERRSRLSALAAVNAEQAALARELSASSSVVDTREADIRRLVTEERALQARLASASEATTEAEIADIRRSQAALTNRIRQVRGG
jgi:hypothetical protein